MINILFIYNLGKIEDCLLTNSLWFFLNNKNQNNIINTLFTLDIF